MEASEKCVVGEKCLVVSQLISRALGQDDVISQFVPMISTQLGGSLVESLCNNCFCINVASSTGKQT